MAETNTLQIDSKRTRVSSITGSSPFLVSKMNQEESNQTFCYNDYVRLYCSLKKKNYISEFAGHVFARNKYRCELKERAGKENMQSKKDNINQLAWCNIIDFEEVSLSWWQWIFSLRY